jgi:hypothetical protein
VSNNAESTARDGASTTNAAGMATSLTGTLAGMFLIVALGLGVAGLLYRVVTAVARRRQIIVHHPESNWIGDENPHHWQRHQSVDERNQFIDDSHRSPVSGANDYDVRPLHPANDEWSNNARPTGGASQITNEVSEHEERLAQLRRDLDRLLQLPKRA